jgi:hypothetical protein
MKDVKRGQPKVIGIDREYPGLIQVHAYLEPAPDEHWATIFRSPNGYGHPVSMHPPALHHHRVELRPPDGEIEQYIVKLDERIRLTNKQYERDVLPQLEAAREAKRAAEQRERNRLDAAQRVVDETA